MSDAVAYVELQIPGRNAQRVWARVDANGRAVIQGRPVVLSRGQRILYEGNEHRVAETTILESGEMRVTTEPPLAPEERDRV